MILIRTVLKIITRLQTENTLFSRTERGIFGAMKNVGGFFYEYSRKTLASSELIEKLFTGAGRLFFIPNERSGKKFVFPTYVAASQDLLVKTCRNRLFGNRSWPIRSVVEQEARTGGLKRKTLQSDDQPPGNSYKLFLGPEDSGPPLRSA